jgi:hypothetical protein
MNVRIFFDFMTLILKVPEFKILERKVYYIFLQNGFQIYEININIYVFSTFMYY